MAAKPISNTPNTAAAVYPPFTPRIGIEMISEIQNSTFSTTAEPSPAVANAKPASGPGTPDNVISR